MMLRKVRAVASACYNVCVRVASECYNVCVLLEKFLDKWGPAPFLTLIAFGATVIYLYLKKIYASLQLVEASVIGVAAIIASINYIEFGKAIDSALRSAGVDEEDSKAKLFQNFFVILNVIVFASALYFLKFDDVPYIAVLGPFAVFLSFVFANLVQAGAMNQIFIFKICHSASGTGSKRLRPAELEKLGALLLRFCDLIPENGPSMLCYAILITYFACTNRSDRRPELFGNISAGAAIFHLTISVVTFLIKIVHTNPLETTIEHVPWDRQTPHLGIGPRMTLGVMVHRQVGRSVYFWSWTSIACLVIVLTDCGYAHFHQPISRKTASRPCVGPSKDCRLETGRPPDPVKQPATQGGAPAVTLTTTAR